MFDLGIGGLYKGFKSFMNPEKGYEKGQEQFDKYYNQAQGYQQPYNEHGQEAYGHLNNAMQQLLNPSDLYDQWINNYEMSDAARHNQERTKDSGFSALSSMGMLGSTPGIQAMQGGLSNIGAEDEQRYIDRMIQQYLQGANLAQGIYGQGAQAGSQMGQNAMNMGNNSAQMAFGRQNAPGEMMGGLIKAGLGASGGGWNTSI